MSPVGYSLTTTLRQLSASPSASDLSSGWPSSQEKSAFPISRLAPMASLIPPKWSRKLPLLTDWDASGVFEELWVSGHIKFRSHPSLRLEESLHPVHQLPPLFLLASFHLASAVGSTFIRAWDLRKNILGVTRQGPNGSRRVDPAEATSVCATERHALPQQNVKLSLRCDSLAIVRCLTSSSPSPLGAGKGIGSRGMR